MTMSWKNNLTSLGSHVKMQKGYAFKSKWYTEKGHLIVKVSNFTNDSIDTSDIVCIPEDIAKYYLKYKLKTGDVIIQTVGSWPTNPQSVVGKVVQVPSNANGALLNQNAVKLTSDDHLDNEFLFYLLRTDDFKLYIIGTAQGAANQASITLNSIKDFTFPMPPLSIQRKISSILSAYDALIKNNLRRIQILEEMAKTIYQEWFINFQFPGHEKVQMVDSPLGKIPEDWRVCPLREVSCLIKRGISPIYDDSSPSIVINQRCIRNFRLDLSKSRLHKKKVPTEKYLLHGDVLINSTGIGTLGRVAQVQQEMSDCTVDSHVTIVRPGKDEDSEFFGLQLFSLQTHFERQGVGTTGQSELGREVIANTEYLRPPRKLQVHFSRTVRPLRALAVQLDKRNNLLRCTRDLLLPKLISGELDVSNLEIHVGGEDT